MGVVVRDIEPVYLRTREDEGLTGFCPANSLGGQLKSYPATIEICFPAFDRKAVGCR